MKILYILKHNPWGIGGGCYACHNYLEAFSTIYTNAQIDVCICAEYLQNTDKQEFPNANFIPMKERSIASKLLAPITGILHRHQNMASKLLKQNNYDLCIFDHNSIAGSLCLLCKKMNIKTIVINHNCEYDYFKDNTPSLIKRLLLLPAIRRNERISYTNCDYNLFLTEEDKTHFATIYKHSTTKKIVSGCFLSRNVANCQSVLPPFNKDAIKIVISGTIGNVQNMDGITYFLDELYQILPQNVEVVITGKNPPKPLIERLKNYANITLIPNPENMDEVIHNCDIFLCPTRLGGGIKLRIMDGLRNGLPIIAHKVSARGYGDFIKNGMMSVFSNKDEFRVAIETVLTNIRKDRISKTIVRDYFFRNCNFANAVAILSTISIKTGKYL